MHMLSWRLWLAWLGALCMCGDAAPADDGREPACIRGSLYSLVDGSLGGVPCTLYQVLYHVSCIFKRQGIVLVIPMPSCLSSVTITSIPAKPFLSCL